MFNFLKKPDNIEVKELKRELENLKNDLEKLKLAFSEVTTKYLGWLEEKELYNRELRDKISKKLEYINKKDDKIDFKEIMRRKLLLKSGLISQKDINTASE